MTNVTQKSKKCNTNVNDNVDCRKKYNQKPEFKAKKSEYTREYQFAIKNNWDMLSEKEQLELINKKAMEILNK